MSNFGRKSRLVKNTERVAVEKAGWDGELLAIELQGLIDLDFDMEVIGFSMAEIDLTIDGQKEKKKLDTVLDAVRPIKSGPAVTRSGDLWLPRPHRL